jgi:hypothetical protein
VALKWVTDYITDPYWRAMAAEGAVSAAVGQSDKHWRWALQPAPEDTFLHFLRYGMSPEMQERVSEADILVLKQLPPPTTQTAEKRTKADKTTKRVPVFGGIVTEVITEPKLPADDEPQPASAAPAPAAAPLPAPAAQPG